jgi:hypothetical protein
MLAPDDTQPKRPNLVPPPSDYVADFEQDTGPGCLIWGLIGAFCLLLALATVLLASFAGWTEGLRVGQGNATATINADIAEQCQRIPQDIANGSMGLVQARLDTLSQFTPAPPCIATHAPAATALYLQSHPTATPTLTPTLAPSHTVTPSDALTQATQDAPPSPTASTQGGFDLGALLTEARNLLSAGDNRAAIETLDAISAVDPQYQKGAVDQLLYQALTTEARRLYRTGTSLAEAVLLTNRAEQYGDVGELNYERYIAELYLQAQIYLDVNFPRAIQQLSQIVYTQNLPNYLNASSLLNDQFIKYGDALALQGDYCNAQRQYESAFAMVASASVASKRDDATQKCQQGVLPVLTPDPNATPTEGASGGFAPIGVRP